MKAIFTKWVGPTMTKPARIKAYDGDNSQTWSYDELYESTRDATHYVYQLRGLHGPRYFCCGGAESVHYEAARRFVGAMEWNHSDGSLVTLASGGTKEGYVWVMLD